MNQADPTPMATADYPIFANPDNEKLWLQGIVQSRRHFGIDNDLQWRGSFIHESHMPYAPMAEGAPYGDYSRHSRTMAYYPTPLGVVLAWEVEKSVILTFCWNGYLYRLEVNPYPSFMEKGKWWGLAVEFSKAVVANPDPAYHSIMDREAQQAYNEFVQAGIVLAKSKVSL